MDYTNYEMPAQLRLALHRNYLKYRRFPEKPEDNAYRAFQDKQAALVADTEQFFNDPLEHNRLDKRKKTLPSFSERNTQRQNLKNILRSTQGLLIAEPRGSAASKKFLIDNMHTLADQGVKYLYLEHLISDLHQADLDLHFQYWQTKMPAQLEAYLRKLDHAHKNYPDQRYTFLALVEAAHNARIKIIGLDCAASYAFENMPTSASQKLRRHTLSYFGKHVIEHYSSPASADKWVGLVDAIQFNTLDSSALGDMTGALVARVEPGRHDQFNAWDLGTTIEDKFGRAIFAQGDIQIKIRSSFELTQSGQFFIDWDAKTIRHRLRGGKITTTAIQLEGNDFYILNPVWSKVHQKLYPHTRAGIVLVIRNLEESGLQFVGFRAARSPADLQKLLLETWQFCVNVEGREIRHRSVSQEIVLTPIHENDGTFYVDRPQWEGVHGKRYQKLSELVSDLQKIGMHLRMDPNKKSEFATLFTAAAITDPSELLKRPGDFLVKDVLDEIWHLSRTDEIIVTPIYRKGDRLYVKKPEWRKINEKFYKTVQDLVEDLEQHNMHYVRDKRSQSALFAPLGPTDSVLFSNRTMLAKKRLTADETPLSVLVAKLKKMPNLPLPDRIEIIQSRNPDGTNLAESLGRRLFSLPRKSGSANQRFEPANLYLDMLRNLVKSGELSAFEALKTILPQELSKTSFSTYLVPYLASEDPEYHKLAIKFLGLLSECYNTSFPSEQVLIHNMISKYTESIPVVIQVPQDFYGMMTLRERLNQSRDGNTRVREKISNKLKDLKNEAPIFGMLKDRLRHQPSEQKKKRVIFADIEGFEGTQEEQRNSGGIADLVLQSLNLAGSRARNTNTMVRTSASTPDSAQASTSDSSTSSSTSSSSNSTSPDTSPATSPDGLKPGSFFSKRLLNRTHVKRRPGRRAPIRTQSSIAEYSISFPKPIGARFPYYDVETAYKIKLAYGPLQLGLFGTPEDKAAFAEGKKNVLIELEKLDIDITPADALKEEPRIVEALNHLYAVYAENPLNFQQQGAVLQRIHDLNASLYMKRSAAWQQLIERAGGGQVKLMPQGIYLHGLQRLTGVCHGLATYVAAAAMRDAAAQPTRTLVPDQPFPYLNLDHVDNLMGKLWNAANKPDTVESRFLDMLLQYRKDPERAASKLAYTGPVQTMDVTQLLEELDVNQETSRFFGVMTENHALAAGSWKAFGKTVYLFYDPNFGYGLFHSKVQFSDFLQHYFFNKEFVHPLGLNIIEGSLKLAVRRFQNNLNSQDLFPKQPGLYKAPLSVISDSDPLVPLNFESLIAVKYQIYEQIIADFLQYGVTSNRDLLFNLEEVNQKALKTFLQRNDLWSELEIIEVKENISEQTASTKVKFEDYEGYQTESTFTQPEDLQFLHNYKRLNRYLNHDLVNRLLNAPGIHALSAPTQQNEIGLDVFYLSGEAHQGELFRSPIPIVEALVSPLAVTGSEEGAAQPTLPTLNDERLLASCLLAIDMERLSERLNTVTQQLLADTEEPQRWIPLFHTVEESPEGQIRIQFSDREAPDRLIERFSKDQSLLEVKKILEQGHALRNGRGGRTNISAPEVEAPHGLNGAFAAQALIQWLWGKDRDKVSRTEAKIDHSLSIALDIHQKLNLAQIGLGIAQDGTQISRIIQNISQSAAPYSFAGNGRGVAFVDKTFGAFNGLLNIAFIGLDITELSRAQTETQRAVFGTHLAFDSANLGLSIAALAGVEGAGPLGLIIVGLGYGISGLVDTYASVAERATAVGAYFDALYRSYTTENANESAGYQYDAVNQRLLPKPHAVIEELNLVDHQVTFDSPMLHASIHGSTGSGKINYIFWAGDKPRLDSSQQRALNLQQRIPLPKRAALPANALGASQLVLPATPKSFISYDYNLLPFATARRSPGFDLLRRLEGDDFDFDFYIFPSEYIIDHTRFEYVFTPIRVLLRETLSRLDMPLLPPVMQGHLHYTLQANSGQYIIGLRAGAKLSLSTRDSEKTTWILDARDLKEDSLLFGPAELTVGGVKIQVPDAANAGTVKLIRKNGDVQLIDIAQKQTSILVVNAAQWTAAPNNLIEHLHDLLNQHQLKARYIQINDYTPQAIVGQPEKKIPCAYYEVEKDRYLYIGDNTRSPDAKLAAQLGNDVYFYNQDRNAIWRVDADSHEILTEYTSPNAGPLQIRLEGDTLFMSAYQEQGHQGIAVYQMRPNQLILQRIPSAPELIQQLEAADHISDPATLLQSYLGLPAPPQKQAAKRLMGAWICIDNPAGQQSQPRYWLRPEDGAVLKLTLQTPADLALSGSQRLSNGDEAFFFYSAQQQKIYRQAGLGTRSASPDRASAVAIEAPKILHVANLQGTLYATTNAGELYAVEASGQLSLVAVNHRWRQDRPAWWQDLRELAGGKTVSVLDLKTSEGRPRAVWITDNRIVAASDDLPAQLQLLGLSPDREQAWLYDRKQGALYAQPLIEEERLRQVLANSPEQLSEENAVPLAEERYHFADLVALGNTLTLKITESATPLPLINGVQQLILVSNAQSAPYAIDKKTWAHYKRFVIDHSVEMASDTHSFSVELAAQSPLALYAYREGNDLSLFDRSTGTSLILRRAFTQQPQRSATLWLRLPNEDWVSSTELCNSLGADSTPLQEPALTLEPALTPAATLIPPNETPEGTAALVSALAAEAPNNNSPKGNFSQFSRSREITPFFPSQNFATPRHY